MILTNAKEIASAIRQAAGRGQTLTIGVPGIQWKPVRDVRIRYNRLRDEVHVIVRTQDGSVVPVSANGMAFQIQEAA